MAHDMLTCTQLDCQTCDQDLQASEGQPFSADLVHPDDGRCSQCGDTFPLKELRTLDDDHGRRCADTRGRTTQKRVPSVR